MLSKKTGQSSQSGNFNTISENWYGTSKTSAKPQRFQTKSQKSLGSNPAKPNRYDLYSNFSKQTLKTYKSIQSQTQSRLEKELKLQNSQLLSQLKGNEFIPPETLDQFIEKHKMNRPSKKIFFAKPRGQDEKRELLAEYL